MKSGKFIISLDFELMWGVRDKKTIASYGTNIKNVHQVIPRLLELFKKYDVNATFSTVGFLFFKNREELVRHLPAQKPSYSDTNLSPYNGYLDTIGKDVSEDLYHFGNKLIELIKTFPNHEIGSHTFSHYYCLEEGQNMEQFKDDLQTAAEVAKLNNIQLQSLVFPRNQFNNEYLEACSQNGIICYRGNEKSWIYDARNKNDESKFRRAFRLLDAYINISGQNCYSNEELKTSFPMNIPASRFLRPYSRKLKMVEKFRLKRILNGMNYAAQNNLTYHLWWHPHNFGSNVNENFTFLEEILKNYERLNQSRGFQSYTMSNLAKQLLKDERK